MIQEHEKHNSSQETQDEESLNQAGDAFTPEMKPSDLEGEISTDQENEEQLRKDLEKARNEYLYLFSEFENFKKRTLKERMELLKNASQDVIISMLPVLDDFERAIKSMEESKTEEKVLEGVILIQNKLKSALEQKGLKKMNSVGEQFDTDFHEAITQVPATEASPVNTVVDEAECGYLLNEKVIRHAKVVVAG